MAILIAWAGVCALFGILTFAIIVLGQAQHEEDMEDISAGRAKRIELGVKERLKVYEGGSSSPSTTWNLVLTNDQGIRKVRRVPKAFWDEVAEGDAFEAYVMSDGAVVIPAIDKDVPSSVRWIVLMFALAMGGTPLGILLLVRSLRSRGA